METNFNFKSQICTTREQSERLLGLGLKKETADMCWRTTTLNGEPITYPSQDVWLNGSIITNNHFPAWSLDRLKELYKCVGDTSLWNLDDVNYDRLIQCIDLAIKHNSFNKEYLV